MNIDQVRIYVPGTVLDIEKLNDRFKATQNLGNKAENIESTNLDAHFTTLRKSFVTYQAI